MDELHKDWLDMIHSIGAKNMPYGIHGGNEWISYKQISDNDFVVEIFTHNGFETFSCQKNAVIDFFEDRNSVLVTESKVKDVPFGYWSQLEFMDKSKYEAQMQAKNNLIEKLSAQKIGTQINGSVNTGGGNINAAQGNIEGNNIHSTNTTDEKWFQKEIVKMILSFAGGVAATLVAQYIMRILGWIS